MIIGPAFFVGALFGAWRAYKLQGSRLDMLQYAAAHGIAFFLISLFLTILFDWQGVV